MATLDTNVLIDFLDGVQSTEKLFISIKNGDIQAKVSTLVECELLSTSKVDELEGYKKSVELLLTLFDFISVDRIIAKKAGELRRKYKIKTPDAIIAASAITTKDKILITNNKKDFIKIENLNVFSPKEFSMLNG